MFLTIWNQTAQFILLIFPVWDCWVAIFWHCNKTSTSYTSNNIHFALEYFTVNVKHRIHLCVFRVFHFLAQSLQNIKEHENGMYTLISLTENICEKRTFDAMKSPALLTYPRKSVIHHRPFFFQFVYPQSSTANESESSRRCLHCLHVALFVFTSTSKPACKL